jgi:hypothetical protein
MPDIGDVMDVTIDDLSPKQQQQLKDATDQFQMKCLMSFGKNRSGVPYLKSEMPRVLLPGNLTPHLFKRKKRFCRLFGILQKLCWVGIIRPSWACSSR